MTKQAFKILKSATGDRAVKLQDGTVIPADIAGLAAGADKWLSEIVCKCRDCGKPFPLSQLHGGGQWCEPCQEASVVDSTDVAPAPAPVDHRPLVEALMSIASWSEGNEVDGSFDEPSAAKTARAALAAVGIVGGVK